MLREHLAAEIPNPRAERGPYSTNMREILGKMWLLENKTQWLEKREKEAEDKIKQLEASVAATNDVACPNSRTEDASTGKKRNCQGRAPQDLLGRQRSPCCF